MMLLQYYFLIFFYKNICYGYSLELPRLVPITFVGTRLNYSVEFPQHVFIKKLIQKH